MDSVSSRSVAANRENLTATKCFPVSPIADSCSATRCVTRLSTVHSITSSASASSLSGTQQPDQACLSFCPPVRPLGRALSDHRQLSPAAAGDYRSSRRRRNFFDLLDNRPLLERRRPKVRFKKRKSFRGKPREANPLKRSGASVSTKGWRRRPNEGF